MLLIKNVKERMHIQITVNYISKSPLCVSYRFCLKKKCVAKSILVSQARLRFDFSIQIDKLFGTPYNLIKSPKNENMHIT